MTAQRSTEAEPRVPFWAKCKPCGHVWTCAHTPMMLTAMGKLLGGLHCPMCGADAKQITPAKQDNGKLLEPTAAPTGAPK